MSKKIEELIEMKIKELEAKDREELENKLKHQALYICSLRRKVKQLENQNRGLRGRITVIKREYYIA